MAIIYNGHAKEIKKKKAVRMHTIWFKNLIKHLI